MIQEQIFQLKITALQLAQGDLQQAQANYAWITQEVTEAEAAKAASKAEALALVK